MSSSQTKNRTIASEEDHTTHLTKLIDSINNNNMARFYSPTSDSLFKRQIDELNFNFYLETEKILSERSTRSNMVQFQDRLFIILFKQINLYIKEIERLNQVIFNQTKDQECIKARMSFSSKRKDDYEINRPIVHTHKTSVSSPETKLTQGLIKKTKIREDNIHLNRENKTFKELIDCNTVSPFFPNDNFNNNQNRINDPPSTSSTIYPKKKRNFSDNNPSPVYNKNVVNCVRIPNLKGIHRSPFMNSNNNKITNFKIIKNVKQKMKNEEENSKMNSPRSNAVNCLSNQEPSIKSGLINDIIKYENHINDLTEIEGMLTEMKKINFPIKKNKSLTLTSVTIDIEYNNKFNIDTPHFQMIPSFISAD